ncbi:MAG: ATP-binding protein [Clostridiales bacterium]|nr:ATP-binding protein [Clostridiales bacterium]
MNDFNDYFSNALKSGTLSHAIILEGENEKTLEMAKVLSAALVCESDGEKPCFKCPACVKAMADTQSEQSNHPDILVYSGKDTPRSFSVDTVREIRDDAFVMPNEANRKVYVLLKAHSMGNEAQNALLKILEEPPEFVTFILTCQSRSQMLSTILSRCVCYSFSSEIQANQDEEIISLCNDLAKAIVNDNEYDLLTLSGAFEKNNQKLNEAVSQLILITGDALTIRSGSTAQLVSRQDSTASFLATHLTLVKLAKLLEALQKTQSAIKRNANNNLLITMFCADIRRSIGK